MPPIATDGSSVVSFITFVSPAKTAEPVEMALGPKEPCIGWGFRFPWERRNFGGCSAHRKTLRVTAAVYAAKDNGIISATTAADCIAPDWPVSHWLYHSEKFAHAIRPLDRILWPLVKCWWLRVPQGQWGTRRSSANGTSRRGPMRRGK